MEIVDDTTTAIERRIVYLYCTNNEFANEISSFYRSGMLEGKYLSKLADICFKFHEKFNRAPGDKIDRFIENATALKKMDADTVAELKLIVSGFTSEVPADDVSFEIGEAIRYLAGTAMSLAMDEAKALLAKGKVTEARDFLSALEIVREKRLTGGDIMQEDVDYLSELFAFNAEPIFTLPQELGRLMNKTLTKNSLVAFLGRNKVGKSHWLLYLARMARNQGKFVIYISAGDMTRKQCEKRILQSDAHTTNFKDDLDKQRIPYIDCKKNQMGQCLDCPTTITLLNEFNELAEDPEMKDGYEPCTKCHDKRFEQTVVWKSVERPLMTEELAVEVQDRWRKSGKTGILHVESRPNSSLTCDEFKSIVKLACRQYKKPNPDVIILDYADIMANEEKDPRESTNRKWKFLRACADEFECLVITATQPNADAFSFDDLTQQNFSEDRRKFDHVTAFYAINQKPEERLRSIWRIAPLNMREFSFQESHQAICYGCLALGTPHLASAFHYAPPPPPKIFKK